MKTARINVKLNIFFIYLNVFFVVDTLSST